MLGHILVGLAGIAIVIFLWPILSPTAGRPATNEGRHGRRRNTGVSPPAQRRTCPICRSTLAPGQRIKSIVFSGGTKHREIHEHMSHIFGCPNCYPANSLAPRICPVCHKELPPDGHLVARLFERPGKRDHVHVLGCTSCRRVGKSTL